MRGVRHSRCKLRGAAVVVGKEVGGAQEAPSCRNSSLLDGGPGVRPVVAAAAPAAAGCRRGGRAVEREGHQPTPAEHLPGPLRRVLLAGTRTAQPSGKPLKWCWTRTLVLCSPRTMTFSLTSPGTPFPETSYSENTRRFTSLSDVLYGRVADFLSWCRQKHGSGLDYQSCPTSEDCENNPVDSFWKRASIQYSRDSSGVIYVMLNGSEPTGAYPVKGFFADFEIPYLQKDKITRIEIWVMHEIGGTNVESCGEGSVKILEERLQSMGFRSSCLDDYLPVKLLKCVDHSTHSDCALNSAAASTQREVSSLDTEQSAGFIIPLLVALASGSQM
uniref:ADP-ribosyl cyclase/cyclic ADP-ribose hydrolase 2 isoform X1 n=1 Tax=Ictidomys tridecemlineatus TaxID=43179 RepID=UPI001A9F5197|nr:ADP-ribosyl cyclase/cyclic ADP-ribose hydrolase 2 isoform X1 [Ictidomys tridecemlineatus]